MMKPFATLLKRTALLMIAVALVQTGAAAEKPINVMLLTGQCSQYHNWN